MWERERRDVTRSALEPCRGFLAYVSGDLGLALYPLESLRRAFLTGPCVEVTRLTHFKGRWPKSAGSADAAFLSFPSSICNEN